MMILVQLKNFIESCIDQPFAVQARELTTQQSIMQDQIEKFGDHMFEHGAMVIPGEINIDLHYNSVKLTSFTGTLANFNNNTVTGGTSGLLLLML